MGMPWPAAYSAISLAMFSAVGLTSIRYSGSPSFSQHGHGRIVAVEYHAVVQIFVDPAADHRFDLVEIEHHSLIVQRRGLDRNNRPAVMSVQMPALALVVQQPMAVTKIDFSGNAKHVRE